MVILHLSTPVLADVDIRWRIGIQALSQAISPGAMHDAAERNPPPGTREKVTEDIVRWIEEPISKYILLCSLGQWLCSRWENGAHADSIS